MTLSDEKSVEEMAKCERRDYFKQWRAANKDKIKRHNADYWKRRAQKKLNENHIMNGTEVNQ